jgi:transposase InsO family protein
MPCSTISAILKRHGMGKLGRLVLEPTVRDERERPGELIHIDVKTLGRIKGGASKRITGGRGRNGRPSRTDAEGHRRNVRGWEAVHVAVDDATRLAYVEVLPDERATTAIGFLRRAIAFYRRHGITVERLITDNGAPYRAAIHAAACHAMGIRHLHTRPYRPQTNGKAERFIRTMLGGWAYGAIYRSSTERTAALDGWLWHYTITADTKPSADKPQPPACTTCLGPTDLLSGHLLPRTARAADRPEPVRPRPADPRRARRRPDPAPLKPVGLPADRPAALHQMRQTPRRRHGQRQKKNLQLLRLLLTTPLRQTNMRRRAHPSNRARSRRARPAHAPAPTGRPHPRRNPRRRRRPRRRPAPLGAGAQRTRRRDRQNRRRAGPLLPRVRERHHARDALR